jgi:hypothetical protein
MTDVAFADFNAITRKVYEYAYGIDTRDWVLYRSIFTDSIRMTFTSYNGNPPADMQADDWVAGVKVLFTGLNATQHSMSNPLVEVNGDRARCLMYMQAAHFFFTDQGDNEYSLGGYYDDELVRTDAGWKISAVTLNVLWHSGNRHIMELATQAGAAKLGHS